MPNIIDTYYIISVSILNYTFRNAYSTYNYGNLISIYIKKIPCCAQSLQA